MNDKLKLAEVRIDAHDIYGEVVETHHVEPKDFENKEEYLVDVIFDLMSESDEEVAYVKLTKIYK